MYRFFLTTILFLWICLSINLKVVDAENLSSQASKVLRSRLEPATQNIVCAGELLCASPLIRHFYKDRSFQPAWSSDEGSLLTVYSLMNTIYRANLEGLRSTDYHISRIKTIIEDIYSGQADKRHLDSEKLADLDLLLTDAFLLFSSHLMYGRVNPKTIHTEWMIDHKQKNLIKILQTAIHSNKIQETLKGLPPARPDYTRLRQELSRYRNIGKKGGWPEIQKERNIKKGDHGKRIIQLRTRLVAEGYLDKNFKNKGELFDAALDQAVREFQGRHGLMVDGIVGPSTLAVLNVKIGDRIRQIELNMERLRWLPGDIGESYIIVNTANFGLELVDNRRQIMTMRVVVGKQYRRTPVFSSKMTYLVLNPYWYIPTSIAIKDILPKIQKENDYLTEQKIRVFQNWNYGAPEIDPEIIDWSNINKSNFIYKLRQDPGPLNALGHVKFIFPNRFNVYLHDTPARELFKESRRDFSSGCIRIEKPIQLAEYLLRHNQKWPREKILAAIDTGVRQIAPLQKPIIVHVLYWTAWIDKDRFIQFRDDIYGRDKKLDKALSERPPNR